MPERSFALKGRKGSKKVEEIEKQRDKSSKKVGCPWRIVINKQAKSIVWKVTTVILEHQNHEEIQTATKITPEIQDQIKGLKSHWLQPSMIKGVLQNQGINLTSNQIANATRKENVMKNKQILEEIPL